LRGDRKKVMIWYDDKALDVPELKREKDKRIRRRKDE